MILRMKVGELTCQGAASWSSKLCLLQERNPHLSLFQPLDQIGWIWVGMLQSQLISPPPPPFSFSMYFMSLMASFKHGKNIVRKHYPVHFKHDLPPFLPLPCLIIAGDPLEKPVFGQPKGPKHWLGWKNQTLFLSPAAPSTSRWERQTREAGPHPHHAGGTQAQLYNW